MWTSKIVTEQSEAAKVLSEISKDAHEYQDPTLIGWKSRIGIRIWRPNRKVWVGLVVLFAAVGEIGIITGIEEDFAHWIDITVKIVIPVFVLGVSITTVARSLGESTRFAGEYLNDSCRMEDFWLVTFGSVALAIFAAGVGTLSEVPDWVKSGASFGSFGGSIGCAYMLGFVLLDTIRCSSPKGATYAAANYAARKLCCAFSSSTYLRLFNKAHAEKIENWCKKDAKAIKSPKEYYGQIYLQSEKVAENNVIMKQVDLPFAFDAHEGYLDFELKHLAKLNAFLEKKSAELFLAPHGATQNKAVLGILRGKATGFDRLHSKVINRGKRCCRFSKDDLEDVKDKVWSELFRELEKSLQRSVKNRNIDEIQTYLEAIGDPLRLLRRQWRQRIVRDACTETYWRCYEIVDLYVSTLRYVIDYANRDENHDEGLIVEVTRELRSRIWDEVQGAFGEGDWITVKLFTSVVPRLYRVVTEAKFNKGSGVLDERGKFGGFYAFAKYLFDEAKMDEQTEGEMRKVLHNGITEWMMIALEKSDSELIEPLCQAARDVVFQKGPLKFEKSLLIAQHFVLAGRMLRNAIDNKSITPDDLKGLFFDKYERDPKIDFNELADFYLNNQFPLGESSEYMRVLDPIKMTEKDPLTGSRGGSGFGSTGSYETALAFVYLSGYARPQLKGVKVRAIDFGNVYVRNAIDKLKQGDNLQKVYKHLQIDLFGPLEQWLKDCQKEFEKEERTKIAKANLDIAMVSQFVSKFNDGYKKGNPFLEYCIRNGHVHIDNTAKQPLQFLIPKVFFVKEEPVITVGFGDEQGFDVAQESERNLLRMFCGIETFDNAGQESIDEEIKAHGEEIKNNAKAAGEWLEGRGCDSKNGIIVFIGKVHPEIILFEDERFTPAWKEKSGTSKFTGFYNDFPIMWLGVKSETPYCVALDMRGWSGICAREEVLQKEIYSKITIDLVSDAELDKAISDGQTIDQNQRELAKNNCWVKGELFWELKGDKPPREIFKMATPPKEVGPPRLQGPGLNDHQNKPISSE